MISENELTQLLQAAETAGGMPQAPADLMDRIYARRKSRIIRTRRIRVGAFSAVVAFAISAALISRQFPGSQAVRLPTEQSLADKSQVEPGSHAFIASASQLAAEVAELKAEGDALEEWIAARERAERIAELAAEQD